VTTKGAKTRAAPQGRPSTLSAARASLQALSSTARQSREAGSESARELMASPPTRDRASGGDVADRLAGKRDTTATTTEDGNENENDKTSATGRAAAATQRGPPTGRPIRRLFRAAWQTLLGDDAPQPIETKKRREDGDGDFRKLAAKFLRRLKARRFERFRTAAWKGLRFVRIIRLSREEWGAADAHLQTTLHLFDQPGSRASQRRSENAVRSHCQPPENRNSLGL
jgi:hypothetical protein